LLAPVAALVSCLKAMPQEPGDPSILAAALRYWREHAQQKGPGTASRDLLGAIWEFVRDSTPGRLRRRFGDADYDWQYRVNTTSGAVRWRERLLGNFYSAYQPTEREAFHEMLEALRQQANLNLAEFTFIDLGSGKGRTVLMASDYPFRRILGVELLPALNQIARENIKQYKSDSQKCFDLESICADATRLPVPQGPLVIYLFNPFPEVPFRAVLRNIEDAFRSHPRQIYIVYYNPELERVLFESTALKKVFGTHQYSIFTCVW
jgi:Histone methylation protein DOT1